MAQNCGAVAYGVSIFWLWVKSFAEARGNPVTIVMFAGLWWGASCIVYALIFRLALTVQEFGKVDSGSAIDLINRTTHRVVITSPQGDRGASRMENPETVGLADPGAMRPVERKDA